MPIAKKELEAILLQKFAASDIDLIDLVGDNDHYEVKITSDLFNGLSKIQQHKMVYEILGNRVGKQIHAISLKTQCKS